MAGPNLVTVNKELQTRPCIEGNAHRQNCISVNVDWGASSRCHLIVVRLEGVGAVSQSPDKFTSLRRCLERISRARLAQDLTFTSQPAVVRRSRDDRTRRN